MRKYKHEGRFHTADFARPSIKEQRNRAPTGRRAHGIWTHMRSLTPKETAALKKRLDVGVYANAH